MKRAHMYAKICRRYTLWWWWNRRQPTTKEFSAWAQKCFRFQNRGVGKSKEKRHEPLVEFLFVPTALCIHGDGGTAWSMSQFLPWWGERESEKHFIGKTFSLIPSQESFLFEIFFALVTNTSSQFHEWSGWIQRETRLTWWRNKKPKILFLEARKSLFFSGMSGSKVCRDFSFVVYLRRFSRSLKWRETFLALPCFLACVRLCAYTFSHRFNHGKALQPSTSINIRNETRRFVNRIIFRYFRFAASPMMVKNSSFFGGKKDSGKVTSGGILRCMMRWEIFRCGIYVYCNFYREFYKLERKWNRIEIMDAGSNLWSDRSV